MEGRIEHRYISAHKVKEIENKLITLSGVSNINPQPRFNILSGQNLPSLELDAYNDSKPGIVIDYYIKPTPTFYSNIDK